MTIKVGDKFTNCIPGNEHIDVLEIEAILSDGSYVGLVTCPLHQHRDSGIWESEEDLLASVEGGWTIWDGVTLVPLPPPIPPEVIKYGCWFTDEPGLIHWFDDYSDVAEMWQRKMDEADNLGTPRPGAARFVWDVAAEAILDFELWQRHKFMENLRENLGSAGMFIMQNPFAQPQPEEGDES